jgi:hypothetical protein
MDLAERTDHLQFLERDRDRQRRCGDRRGRRLERLSRRGPDANIELGLHRHGLTRDPGGDLHTGMT